MSVPQRGGMIWSEPKISKNIKTLQPANLEDVTENLNYK